MRKVGKIAVSLISLGVLAATVYLWTPTGPVYDEGDIRDNAAQYNAEIIRDNYGVPHIYGVSDADASFGLAYAHSEDDWETIQQSLIETRGDAALHYGQKSAPTDYLNDLFKVHDFVEQKYETELNDQVKAISEAYAAGINLFAINNPDRVARGLLPITAHDVIAGFVFGTPFFYRMDEDLKALFSSSDRPQISPWGRDANLGNLPQAVRGSNAFAVAPKRSTDGYTRLVINSHQPMTGRYAWYEAHLTSEEGWNIIGANFPGVPFLVQGVTPTHGWGQTVNKPDLIDIYALTVDDEKDPKQYKIDGQWKDFERSYSKFRVKLWGPFSLPIKRDVLWSDHGPVLSTETGYYALRFAGLGEVEQIEQWYAMSKATDIQEWKEALAQNTVLSFNMIYADKDGNIGALYNAQMPKRIEGPEWTKILPGDRSDLIWTENVPVSDLPQMYNPESGWLFSANHTPFRMSEAGSVPLLDSYSDTFGIPTRMTNRSLRGLELLSADASISKEELLNYRADTFYSDKSTLRKFVNDLLLFDFEDESLRAAQTILKQWNGDTSRTNRAAALAVLTGVQALGAQYIEEVMSPEAAFKSSIDLLLKSHGRLDPEWGEVNRLLRGDVNVALDGAPDVLRAIYGDPKDVRDDGVMNAVAGDTHIIFAEWDEQGVATVSSIHQYGAATLDENSPHYSDQAELFSQGQYKPMPLHKEGVLEIAKERYRPGQR